MTEVLAIADGPDRPDQRCQLVFGWGIPEYVAAADLIEDYWRGQTCTGPASFVYGENDIVTGDCKTLWQNWLAKNPFRIISLCDHGMHNWFMAAISAMGTIADYLWNRPDIVLEFRNREWINGGRSFFFSPAEAYAHVKKLTLDAMNGYEVSWDAATSCDYLQDSPENKSSLGAPVKTQITSEGIIPQDARREQYCNIEHYDGSYQN